MMRERAATDGAYLINKPKGLTSAQVVGHIKRELPKGTRIGHGGTLDPFATGVLVILVGEATKLSDIFLHSKKNLHRCCSFRL